MNKPLEALAKNPGLGLALGAVVILGGAWFLWGRQVKGAAAAVGEAVNPASDRNLAYRGVNAVGGALSGQGSSWSFGSWIYDLTHEEYDPNAPPATADERTWWQAVRETIGGG